MKKIVLREKEELEYQVIKKLFENKTSKQRASAELNCSIRKIDRLISGYKKIGKEFFVHGNRKRKPATAIPECERDKIISLYKDKYLGFNFFHFYEKLISQEGIKCSYATIKNILLNENILSPKSHKKTKKIIKDKIKGKEHNPTKIIPLQECHPRKPRAKFFGELLQMDASDHKWFGDAKSQLHLAIDDATGRILGAYFDKQETLFGYYQALSQILENYGVPAKFFTDRRTVFEYKKLGDTSLTENDHPTQFAYACSKLGIEIETSSVPQAKGRVERVFGTLQSRLIGEMKLAGIQDIQTANIFLKEYIKIFNNQFSIEFDLEENVFGGKLPKESINIYLSVLHERKIDKGNCIKIFNNYFFPVNKNGEHVHLKPGTKVAILKALDESLLCLEGKELYLLEKVLTHKTTSENFDLEVIERKEKKKWTPPDNHPWRQKDYLKFSKSQQHKKEEFQEYI